MLDGLGWTEKIILSEIAMLSTSKDCYANNEHFSKILKITKESVSRIISKLTKEGYLISEVKYKQNTKQIEQIRRDLSVSTKLTRKRKAGAILLDEKSLAKVIDKVSAEDFSYSDLREIYKSILKLSDLGKSIDFLTVMDELSNEKLFTQGKLKKLLLLCCETTPCIRNIEYYTDIVHKSALAKRLEESLLSTLLDGIGPESAVQEGEFLIDKLSRIISPTQNKNLRYLSEISQNLIDYYSGKIEKIENRCDTGYSKIDKILKGMSGGNLIILASRPKVGKTAFATSIAENVSETGKKVMFYSQEMLGKELCKRVLSK